MAIKKSFNSTGAYSNKEYLKCQKKQTDTAEIFIKHLKKLKKYVNLEGSILDLGSGSGYFLKACQKLKLKAIGLEGCSESVKFANKISKNQTIYFNLTCKLPFKNNSFQIVHCNSVVEHLRPKIADQLIKETYRVLKKEGLFICACPNYYNFSERHSGHINLYTPTRLRKLLKKNKFEILFEHLSFNISLLSFWSKHGSKPNILRQMSKKYSPIINILISPIWLPIRLTNIHLIKLDLLDIFSGDCFFIARKV